MGRVEQFLRRFATVEEAWVRRSFNIMLGLPLSFMIAGLLASSSDVTGFVRIFSESAVVIAGVLLALLMFVLFAVVAANLLFPERGELGGSISNGNAPVQRSKSRSPDVATPRFASEPDIVWMTTHNTKNDKANKG